MSKLLNKVLGKRGVVNNVAELVKVHPHIDHIKNETSALKAQLLKVKKELAELSEDNVSITQITLHNNYTQQEGQIIELQERLSKMLRAKHDYADVFGDCLNNTLDLQIMTYQNQIREFEEELHNTKVNYDIHMNEMQEKRERLRHEKKELEEKLSSIQAKLEKHERKKDHKQGKFV